MAKTPEQLNNCYVLLVCEMAENFIAINNLRLTEVQDSSQTSMHFEIIYNLLIWCPRMKCNLVSMSDFCL